MSRDTGGLAFPTSIGDPTTARTSYASVYGGMTLRDWFAGQALAAIIQADGAQFFNITTEHAETAYAKADAMIAERSKP